MTQELQVIEHVAAATAKKLSQYKDAPLFAALIEELVRPINELEEQFQKFKTELSLDTAQGVNLTLVGDILNATIRPVDDEEYREILYALVFAYNSNGTYADIFSIYDQLVTAQEILIFDAFPAKFFVYLKFPTGDPDYKFLTAATLLAKAAGVGFLPIQISPSGLSPILGFVEDVDPDTGPYGVLAAESRTVPVEFPYRFAEAGRDGNTYTGNVIESESVGGTNIEYYTQAFTPDDANPGALFQTWIGGDQNSVIFESSSDNGNLAGNDAFYAELFANINSVGGKVGWVDNAGVTWLFETTSASPGPGSFESPTSGSGKQYYIDYFNSGYQMSITADGAAKTPAEFNTEHSDYPVTAQGLADLRTNNAGSGFDISFIKNFVALPTNYFLNFAILEADADSFESNLNALDPWGFEVKDQTGVKWRLAKRLDKFQRWFYERGTAADGVVIFKITIGVDAEFRLRLFKDDVEQIAPSSIVDFDDYTNSSFQHTDFNTQQPYGLATVDNYGVPSGSSIAHTFWQSYVFPPDDTPDIGFDRFVEPILGGGQVREFMLVVAKADEAAFEAELNTGIPGLYVVDKVGDNYAWIPDTAVTFTKQDQTTQVRFFLEMVTSTRKPNGRLWKNGVELKIENDEWDSGMFFVFGSWFRGDNTAFNAANSNGLGKVITIEPANGSYYSLLIPIDSAQAQAEITKILGR